MACSDDIYTLSESSAEGYAMRFEVTVIDQPQTRGEVIDVTDNEITRDFKKGDSFGLFIIDGSGAFVTLIDGKNAKNLKLTTPDGKAWNLESDIKEVVHKLGYKYVAYYPYSADFDNCASTADIQSLLTAPAYDQSSQAATDWMYTEPTDPQTNAVTTLVFKHKYAKIDIYHSFTQGHQGEWTSAYNYTKTVDDNKVEHYRYILNSPSLQTLSINGTYTIGDKYTGIKEYSYNCPDIKVENGRHAIVYTYRMDERCAIDLGLPSGVKWSPINLGVESSNCMADTYMDASEIAAVINKLGIETTSFAALLASFGVAIGMAMSGNLSNFVGGMIILLFKPYRVGDLIEANGETGHVVAIEIFHTILKTYGGVNVYMANGNMSTAVIKNYSKNNLLRVEFKVSVEYGQDLSKVEAELYRIAQTDARVLKDPAPHVNLEELAASSVDLTMKVWVKDVDYWSVKYDINRNIYDRFNEIGISFPFPKLTIHQD